jgi:16S rRNA (guanine1207-N2)-methyltransferase
MSEIDPFAPLLDLLDGVPARRWLFLNAQADRRLVSVLEGQVIAVQPWKADHDACAASGWMVAPSLAAHGTVEADAALIRISKDRDETRGMIADAITALREAAPIYLFGAKDEGMPAHEKWLAALFKVDAPVSKRHGRAIRFDRPTELPEALRNAALEAAPMPNASGLMAQAGFFSARAVDLGSALLAQHLPTDLAGTVADFGCGWGFLSVEALKRAPRIEALHLFEADHRALTLAEHNLSSAAAGRAITPHWLDLTRDEPQKRAFSAVLMNPPFHAGHHADPAIGKRFIAMARHALKPGGRLLMVANRHLPYEETLKASFRMVMPLAAEQGFKVFEARL